MTQTYPSPPSTPSPKNSDAVQIRRRVSEETGLLKTAPNVIVPLKSASISTTEAKESLVVKPNIDATQLKKLLCIHEEKCGSPTQKGHPCKCKLQGEPKEIDTQIELLGSLTQSSPNLLSALQKLAKTVCCKYHNFGEHTEKRAEAWALVFPAGDKEPKPNDPVPLEKQILKVVNCVSTQCIGTVDRNERCKCRIGGQKVTNCAETIAEIIKPEVYMDDKCLEYFLKVLEINMYCNTHSGQRLTKVASWKKEIVDLCNAAEPELVQSIETDNIPVDPRSQSIEGLSAKSGTTFLLQRPALPTPRNTRSLSYRLDREPSTYWPSAFDVRPLKIVRPPRGLADFQSSYKLLQAKITAPLSYTEAQDGYIYLYQVDGNERYVKIGYTGKEVQGRTQNWTFNCNRKSKVLYPASFSSAVRVPNAKRVEALCHAELDHRQVVVSCKACLCPHIEWFEASVEQAIAVIEKWTAWMNTEPYELGKEIRSGKRYGGTLKQAEKKRTYNMSTFLQEVTAAAAPAVVAGPKLDKSNGAVSISEAKSKSTVVVTAAVSEK